MCNIIPVNKSDIRTCERLFKLSNSEIEPYIYELLEWMQDLNWPVAYPVSKRLFLFNTELVEPLLKILNSDDDTWKYWIVSYFLHHTSNNVYDRLFFKLSSMKNHPTKREVDEEVHDAVCELLQMRG
ncbi:DUF5071 domain-containing protein [Vibrio nigripulchritudo]|uniref:DUF5071 domain-containing protein n=1 Tax=Vibrio nigripulchritudo TaxID=28173 RepID=UPI0024905557|nr:DUF5071 domain-containing protein [Vibrio nigripulchritudo]BDU37847.1 hypothetical protein TUMSATVNIG2_23160 [Vibrio nigripulchritudo]BDU43567.1 hypothetical protein TUMSATVNIG3_23650 [Vibrio nigripulchritudo]